MKTQEQKFKEEMYAKTKKYQKIYGFDIGKGSNDTWNNESDAFKHAFMQAVTQFNYGSIVSSGIGYKHEFDGAINHNQPINEANMDLWNNEIGRNIGNKIKKSVRLKRKSDYPQEKIEDMIADEIVKCMKKGELITNPKDTRSYKDKKLGIYEIQKLMKKFGLQTGYAADIRKGKIFTAEEIGNMTSDEFSQNEEAINSQLKEIGVPREFEAKKAVQDGTMIWVNAYVRDDGTDVKGYYRSKSSDK